MTQILSRLVAGLILLAVSLPAAAQTSSAVTLGGVVRLPDGAPAPDVLVVVEHGGGTASVTTNAGGEFSVSGVMLPAIVEVVAPGVGTLRRTVTASPVDLTLSPPTVRESVVVTAASASFRERPLHDPITGLLSLPAAYLDTVPSVTLDEAIRVVSGFSLFRRSTARASNPTTHGVTMRGLSASGASRGLVLLDGVPLHEGFGGWVTWTRLPGTAIGEVSAQRGSQGDLFGSDALGGVIEVVPPAVAAGLVSLHLEAGTEGTVLTEFAGGQRAGRASIFGAASWFRTDGVIPVAPESVGAADRPADTGWANGYGRATVSMGSRRLVLSGWGGREERGNGTVVQRNRMHGGTGLVAFDAADSANHLAARVSVSPNSFFQTFSQVFAGRNAEALTSTQLVDTLATRATVELGRTLSSRIHLVGRAALGRVRADFRDERPDPAATTDRSLVDDHEAVSVQVGVTPAAAVTFGGGLRHEWRKAPGSADGRDTATVGRFLWAWTPADRLTVRGAVASSHRWPTLNELARDFQVGAIRTIANPDLTPERARSADVAVALTGRLWTMTTGAFWSVVDDAIANVTLSANQRQRRNAGDARATGIELDGEVRPLSRLWIRGSATIVDATFEESLEPAIDGKRLPQVPRVSVAASAVVKLPRDLDASVVWRALSEQFDDDRNVFELAAARTLDLRVAGRLRQWGWALSIENVVDTRVEVGRTPLVTLAPGRSIRLGVSWRH
jgi:outer membrane receptor protein involved in Fe transport